MPSQQIPLWILQNRLLGYIVGHWKSSRCALTLVWIYKLIHPGDCNPPPSPQELAEQDKQRGRHSASQWIGSCKCKAEMSTPVFTVSYFKVKV